MNTFEPAKAAEADELVKALREFLTGKDLDTCEVAIDRIQNDISDQQHVIRGRRRRQRNYNPEPEAAEVQ